MAVNLAANYSGKIAEKFALSSVINNKYVNTDYDFHGVQSLTVYTPTTVSLGDYNRSLSANRFGTPTEMQDTKQTLTLSQDKGFSLIIDRGNNEDQMLIKEAGRMLNLQIKEQAVPMMDIYSLGNWVTGAGLRDQLSTAPTKTDVVSSIADGVTKMDNALVPLDGRCMYVRSSVYNVLRQAPEFLGIDALGMKALSKGHVGEIFDIPIIKVPDTYLTGAYFLITHKTSVLRPVKIKTTRILKDVQGIDGAVLEGRYYYDSFVLTARDKGVYAATVA